jgi:hypothetical protein
MADEAGSTGTATEQSQPVPGEELPALFANRFYIVAGPRTTRITFGEGIDNGASRYRSAIVLPMDDAKQLAEVLADLLRKVEVQSQGAAERR